MIDILTLCKRDALCRTGLTAAITFFCAVLLTLAPETARAKYASIVVDVDSGTVLHAANADTRNYPASLTKMMTLYLVFEALEKKKLKLSTPLKVSRRAEGMPPSKLGLSAGQTIRVDDAILALVTKSANDAAVVIAEALGGTEIKFAQQMTRKARSLGMKLTSFRNASGLYNRGQLSTARDMATLSVALLRDYPERYRYFQTHKFTYKGRSYRNHNNLLGRYEGTDGIKTGYIRASGFNLAASVQREGRRLVAVVFGGKTSKSRDRHMMSLLDRSFRKARTLVAVADPASVPPARPVTVASSYQGEPDGGKNDGLLGIVSSARAALPPTWGVQVGAFAAERQAVSAARRARELSNITLWQRPETIVPLQGKKGTLYRTRFLGLDKYDAYKTCKELKAKSYPCMVLKASQG